MIGEIPASGEVWLDSRLFPALGVAVGDAINVGDATLRVGRVLSDEPDRGGSFFDFGPRLLMRMDDVPRTDVVKPGSRISYRLLLAGSDDALEQLRTELEAKRGVTYRWMGIRESTPSIGSALDRAQAFLLLGGLLAVLLAGVAVALAAHRYARRHYDHVAILKTLGATPAEIQGGYLALLGAVGAVAALAGLVAGGALHLLIVAALSAYMPLQLPMPGVKPLLVGAVSGFVCLAAFALPPLMGLKSISPMRVIRRDLDVAGVSRTLTYAFAVIGTLGLLLWYTNSWRLTLWTVAGISGVSIVFGALAYLLLRAGRRLGMQAGSGWRLALAGLARRRGESVAQILIFGLAIMLLLIMVLLRTALLEGMADAAARARAESFPDERRARTGGAARSDGARTRRADGRAVSDDARPHRSGERRRHRRSGKKRGARDVHRPEPRFRTEPELDGRAARQQSSRGGKAGGTSRQTNRPCRSKKRMRRRPASRLATSFRSTSAGYPSMRASRASGVSSGTAWRRISSSCFRPARCGTFPPRI